MDIYLNPVHTTTVEPSELNGFNVMFKENPDGVNGCPMGRGETVDKALLDLSRRVELESHVTVHWVGEAWG